MDTNAAMRRISEADRSREDTDDRDQQHEMYRKTLVALTDVTPEDDDEGVTVVTEWILEELERTGERPSSRAVRQRAVEYCRENGHEISNNAWLGR